MWLAVSSTILVVVIAADVLVAGVVLSGLVVLAPLVASVRLRPAVVAALGGAAVVLVIVSATWNDSSSAGQQLVRTALVLAGSLLAVLIAGVRTRLERERRLEGMLADLIGATSTPPATLVQDIAGALVPDFGEGARIDVATGDGARSWTGRAGSCAAPEEDPQQLEAASDAPVVLADASGWTLTGPLCIGERRIGVLRLRRAHRFPPGDPTLFTRVADRVALALENAILMDDTRALAARVEGERRRLQTVLDELPAAVSIRDVEGRPTITNRRAQEIRDRAAGDGDGDSAEDWFEAHPGRLADGTPMRPEDWPFERSLRTGEIVRGEEFQFERRDGTWAVVRVNSAPIRDARERISAVVSIFDDVTEQHRDRRALHWLAEVGRLLDRPHRVETRVEEILRLLVGEAADAGFVYVCHPDSSITATLEIAGQRGGAPPGGARRRARRRAAGGRPPGGGGGPHPAVARARASRRPAHR